MKKFATRAIIAAGLALGCLSLGDMFTDAAEQQPVNPDTALKTQLKDLTNTAFAQQAGEIGTFKMFDLIVPNQPKRTLAVFDLNDRYKTRPDLACARVRDIQTDHAPLEMAAKRQAFFSINGHLQLNNYQKKC